MTSEKLYDVLGNIRETHIHEARICRRSRKRIWLRWGALAACLMLVVLAGTMALQNRNTTPEPSAGTLPGAQTIYPTVMAAGQHYEWRKGAAICASLPDTAVYYGEVTHVPGEMPVNDCEFVSVFPASGSIYTVPESDHCIYLCLTTDWMEDVVVIFDRVETNG